MVARLAALQHHLDEIARLDGPHLPAVILIHAGFGFGGPLTTVTLILFLLVTLSGIWGLIMQQWLPQKMLQEIPGETVATQINRLGNYHADEASRLISALLTVPPEQEVGRTGRQRAARGGTRHLPRRCPDAVPTGRRPVELAARDSDGRRAAVRPIARSRTTRCCGYANRLQELAELRPPVDAQAGTTSGCGGLLLRTLGRHEFADSSARSSRCPDSGIPHHSHLPPPRIPDS